ncbi:MAG: hypothetical protein M1483_06470 [Actinobacteria bacterium]|nr:hypothetical protein [Actinomycetota bacterium]MCL6105250.1 hypothetical protein [Actinomycetota bacterium]
MVAKDKRSGVHVGYTTICTQGSFLRLDRQMDMDTKDKAQAVLLAKLRLGGFHGVKFL